MKFVNLDILNKSINEVKEMITSYSKYILNKLSLSKLIAGKNINIDKNNVISTESYTVENYGGGKHSVINNITTSNNHKILVHKTNIITYPKVRLARRGHIDLDNCKDIDYVLVPCRYKCLLLLITNKYLKEQSENLLLGEQFGWGESFTYLQAMQYLSDWLSDNKCIIPLEDLDIDKLPLTENDLQLTCKNRHGNSMSCFMYVKKIFAKRRGKWNSIGKRGGDFLVHEIRTFNKYNLFFYNSYKEQTWSLRKTDSRGKDITHYQKLTKTPYIVYRNIASRNTGGLIIPVRNGKLILSEARLCNSTDKLYLVSTGEILEFDDNGRCKNILRPYHKKAWRESGNYRKLFAGPTPDSGDFVHYNRACFHDYYQIYKRRGITKMKKQFREYHFKKWLEWTNNEKPIHESRMYPFVWYNNRNKHNSCRYVAFDNRDIRLHLYSTIYWNLYSNILLTRYQTRHCLFRWRDVEHIKHLFHDKRPTPTLITYNSVKICIGYSDPLGKYQTNRYAPILKYKLWARQKDKYGNDIKKIGLIKI